MVLLNLVHGFELMRHCSWKIWCTVTRIKHMISCETTGREMYKQQDGDCATTLGKRQLVGSNALILGKGYMGTVHSTWLLQEVHSENTVSQGPKPFGMLHTGHLMACQ